MIRLSDDCKRNVNACLFAMTGLRIKDTYQRQRCNDNKFKDKTRLSDINERPNQSSNTHQKMENAYQSHQTPLQNLFKTHQTRKMHA